MSIKCICGNEQFHGSVGHHGLMVDKSGKEVETEIMTVECERCGLKRQIDLPFSTEEEYLKFYETEYPPVNEEYGAKTYEDDRDLSRLRCDSYGLVRGTVAKILDVGSGSGAFVDECRARGIDAYGCEMCRYSYDRGDPFIYRKCLEDVNFPTDHFDIVTCHHVIEHVLDPVGFAKEMFRVTKQEGTCIIEIPRFHHKSGKHHWKRVEHIWYFDLPHIERILTDVGFRVETVEYPVESSTVLHMVKPTQSRGKIIVPPGIGDSYWSIVKMQSFLKSKGLSIPDIYILCPRPRNLDGHRRSFPFIEMFPFLHSTGEVKISASGRQGIWKEAYARQGKTVFENIEDCDYFISYNGHLRFGEALEEIDSLECDWFPPRFVSLEEERFKDGCVERYGRYIVFHFPLQGTYRHWTDQFPVEGVARSVRMIARQTGCIPVFVGAAWDERIRLEIIRKVKRRGHSGIPDVINLIGKTSVAQLFGVLRGAEAVIGYPSGLTIMSAMLRTKTLIVWNDYYNKDFWWNSCPPSTRDRTYFIANTNGLTAERLTSQVGALVGTEQSKEENPREEERMTLPERKKIPSRMIKRKPKVTVACVLKTGGKKFDAKYVLRLKDSVKRHLTVKHDFVCLTDNDSLPDSIHQIPFTEDWPGWWSKLELFRPGLFGRGNILYFDLDTVITGDLDVLATYPHRFTMLYPFNPDKKWGRWASGIMAWNGDFSHIYEGFAEMQPKPFSNPRLGDQVWIHKFLGREPDAIQKVIPGVYSYKRHCRDQLPENARIVCFHGHPRPHELKGPWIREHWR